MGAGQVSCTAGARQQLDRPPRRLDRSLAVATGQGRPCRPRRGEAPIEPAHPATTSATAVRSSAAAVAAATSPASAAASARSNSANAAHVRACMSSSRATAGRRTATHSAAPPPCHASNASA